jgi:long-chain fatty acid transport protein
MRMIPNLLWRRILAAAALTLVLSPTVSATDGYFMIGYGAKSVALGGATVSFPQDRVASANNPAGMALVPAGWDGGLRFLSGIREAELDCRGIGGCDTIVQDRSDRDLFIVPNAGWNKHLTDRLTIGLSTYGNGGINTSYGRALYDETVARIAGQQPGSPGFPSRGKLGADFSQLYIAPTVAWKINLANTVGIAPLFNVQRFSVRGLQSFARLSREPSSVSNRNTEYDLGIGVRIGWIGELRPDLRLGAQYTSRNWVTGSDEYEGLLAGGNFDAPSNFSVGMSWDVTPALTLAFDYQRILWEDIDALANRGPSMAELTGNIAPERLFGAANGIGFGWIDQSVYKLGVRYRVAERLTLRGGWNHATSQIPDHESLINVLAPATIKDNVAIGASWRFAGGSELSVTYQHALKKINRDPSSELFGTPVTIWIYENFLDFSWSHDF